MRSFVKVVVFLLVVAALAGGGYYWWKGRGAKDPKFVTTPIARTTIRQTITATGTLEPRDVIDVGAQVAGQIDSFGHDKSGKRISFDSPVTKNEVLAHIDDRVYVADLTSAKAQLQQSEANVRLAQAQLQLLQAKLRDARQDWDRAKKIGISDALAATQYDAYEATYREALANIAVGEATVAQARAVVPQNQAALQRAQTNLQYCTIHSPVNGVVIDRRVNIGQTVVASLSAPSLFLIARNLKTLQIWAAVNEADIGKVHAGEAVTFTVEAHPNHVFHGVVNKVRLNATMQQNVVTYTVIVDVDNSQKLLLPYMTATLRFHVAKRPNVLAVSNAALRWTPRRRDVTAATWAAFERAGSAAGNKGTIWVARGGYAYPVQVRVGMYNHMIAEVSGRHVQAGMRAIVGEQQNQQGGGGTQNPFLPHRHPHKRHH